MAIYNPWLADRTQQQGIFRVPAEGDPYVDCAATDVGDPGYVAVYDVTVAWGAESGTLIPCLIQRDAGTVWLGEARLTVLDNVARLECSSDYISVGTGTLADGDSVTVSVVLAGGPLYGLISYPDAQVWLTDPANPQELGDMTAGWHFACRGSDAWAFTLDAAAAVGMQNRITRLGTGTVTVTPPSGHTLNGGTAGVSIGAQWRTATIMKIGDTAWALLNA